MCHCIFFEGKYLPYLLSGCIIVGMGKSSLSLIYFLVLYRCKRPPTFLIEFSVVFRWVVCNHFIFYIYPQTPHVCLSDFNLVLDYRISPRAYQNFWSKFAFLTSKRISRSFPRIMPFTLENGRSYTHCQHLTEHCCAFITVISLLFIL